MVSCLSRKPALSLDGRNRSSCPLADLANGIIDQDDVGAASDQNAAGGGGEPVPLTGGD
jgi:hypothetical protein